MVQIRSIPVSMLRIWCLVVLALAPLPAYASQNGPALGLKGGVQRLTSPLTREKENRARFELELSSPRAWDGLMDVSAAVGFSPLGDLAESSYAVENGLEVDRWSSDELRLFDVRLGARFYPLGRTESRFSPYLGAGVGYFWFLDQWEDNVLAYDPVSGDSGSDSAEGTETVAQGFFPFLMAGVNITLSSNVDLLLEVQYDAQKEDHGYDLSGPAYLIGARIRW